MHAKFTVIGTLMWQIASLSYVLVFSKCNVIKFLIYSERGTAKSTDVSESQCENAYVVLPLAFKIFHVL